MSCHVLRDTADEIVVRVMYVADRVPPNRAWYSWRNDGSIAELGFADVEHIETGPWR